MLSTIVESCTDKRSGASIGKGSATEARALRCNMQHQVLQLGAAGATCKTTCCWTATPHGYSFGLLFGSDCGHTILLSRNCGHTILLGRNGSTGESPKTAFGARQSPPSSLRRNRIRRTVRLQPTVALLRPLKPATHGRHAQLSIPLTVMHTVHQSHLP